MHPMMYAIERIHYDLFNMLVYLLVILMISLLFPIIIIKSEIQIESLAIV